MTSLQLKRTVNTAFLALSISLSGYFLFFMSKNPVVKVIAVIFAIMYELANKYMLSAGRTEFKKGIRAGGKGWYHIFTAIILFLFYGVYIVYNILSGAGFFITEIAVQDRISAQTEIVNTAYQQKLEQLNRTINTLNRALEVEVETSYRSRSAAITAELKRCEVEREELLKIIASAPVEKAEEKNPFRDLSKTMEIPMNRLIGIVWCMVMAGICVTLIVTSEDLPDDDTKSDMPKPEPPEVRTNKKTEDVTKNDTEVSKPDIQMPELPELRTNSDNINITSEQQNLIDFAEELWGDSIESIPKELTPLKNIRIPDRKIRKYSDYLESIGAIEKGRGVPPRALWPKEKVIDYIKTHDIAI